MEDYSHATLSKKPSNANVNGFFTPKTVYNDVFRGPSKFGVPTFSAQIEDYSEIFGSFHSSRPSSIPVLHLPVPDAGDISLDVCASKLDYSEIFGDLNGVDFFDSHEELFGESEGVESSSEEAWTPAGTGSPSQGSSADTLACSENNQFMSDGVAHHTVDGVKQFNVSNHETLQRSEENRTNDRTHSSQHQVVQGVAFVVDGSTPPQKTETINTSPCGVNDISDNVDYNRCLLEEKNFKKTMSLPPMYSSITRTSGSDFKLQRSNSNHIFLTVSEISLRTQTSQVPPPMRPPPKLSIKQGESMIASEKYGGECATGDSSPPSFDVEVDVNSSAAASAAAMKEAMEKAQARIISAKELMERKKDGLKNRLKLGSKDDLSSKARKEDNKATHEALRFRGDVSQEASEGEDIGMKGFGRQAGQKYIRTAQVAPDFEGREKLINVGKEFVEQKVTKESKSPQESHIDKEAGEWRVEKQFYDLAKTEKPKAALEVLEHSKNEKKLMTPIITQNHKKSEKVAAKQVFEQQEENGKKSKASKEVSVQENTRILEAAKEAHELKKLEKKLKVAQEMSRCELNEKKLKAAQEIYKLEEDENKLKVACKLGEHRKIIQQAHEQKENEKKLEEAHEWEETDKRRRGASWSEVIEIRLKDANEKEENGKKLKESCKREENEKRLKDLCQQEESENKLQEVHEKEENDKRKNEAPEQEENEKQLKETREQEENEKRLQEAHECEENEKRLKQAFEREENERRLKEAQELEESENRLEEVCKMEENEKQVKEVFELVEDEQRQREANEGEKNGNRQKQACEWEDNENKVKANQEAHDLKVDKNLRTATGSCKPVNDNFEAYQEVPKYEENSRKLKLAQEAIEHEGSGRMTESVKDACECEGNGTELKIAKVGNEEDESGRSGPADVAQCASEQDRYKKIKDSMEGLSLDEHKNKLGESEIAIDLELNEKNKRTTRMACEQESLGNSQVANDQEAYQKSNETAQGVKIWIENEKKTGVAQPVVSLEDKGNMQKIAQEVDKSRSTERKEKNYNETCSNVEREKERLHREKEQEEERLRKIEEEKEREREREREREKDRLAVERATRERAERAAVERANTEARQRAMTEAREKLEKASAEAREKLLAEKSLMEARLRAERAAVERTTAEARKRAAVERATAEARKRAAEKAALDARERAERSVADKFSTTNSRDSGMRQSSSFSDLRDPQLQSSGSDDSSRYTNSSVHSVSYTSGKFQGTEGESPQRCKARLERHQRTFERAAKALVEKNMRDLLAQREQAERSRLAETLDAEVRRWSSGKEGNLRALLSTLHYILGPDSGWQPIPLTEVITAVAVKKAYRKATLCVHPDKLQQKGASIQQKYVCEKIFDLLKEAWNRFNSEER